MFVPNPEPIYKSSLSGYHKYNTPLSNKKIHLPDYLIQETKNNDILKEKHDVLKTELVKNPFPNGEFNDDPIKKKLDSSLSFSSMDSTEQIYLGMISVVGLFILYRVLQRSY